MRARICYRSAREEWIQAMAAAGLGICLIPQFSPVVPGLVTRPLSEPAVIREVCLVTVRGRRLSAA